MNIEFNQAIALYKQTLQTIEPETTYHTWAYIEGLYTCTTCGLVDLNNYQTTLSFTDHKRKRLYPYQRKNYFRKKLQLIAGYRVYWGESLRWNEMINTLKQTEFDTIHELRIILRKKKMFKFYKFIYMIYYQIKKTKAIHLSHQDIEKMLSKFKRFENYCKLNKLKMINYNIIIYALIKHYNIQNRHNIFLPMKYTKSLSIIENFLKL